jgi:SAM-dependent methyltransferase
MRALASLGVFDMSEDRRFSLTPMSRALLTDAPNSLRDMAIYMGEAFHLLPWGEIVYTIKTGEPAAEKVFGMPWWQYFEQNEEARNIFNNAMTSFSASIAPAIAMTYDFSNINTLVDVAGGHGLLLATILKANPHMKGVLFDQPSVIEGAGALLEEQGVHDRVELSSGNFFESVPVGGDAYIMKHIIHDWNDEDSIKILRNIHRAMNPAGRVLLVESVLPPGNEPSLGKFIDLEMLIFLQGKERTESEFRELFAASGFELTRIVHNPSPLSVVEGVRK